MSTGQTCQFWLWGPAKPPGSSSAPSGRAVRPRSREDDRLNADRDRAIAPLPAGPPSTGGAAVALRFAGLFIVVTGVTVGRRCRYGAPDIGASARLRSCPWRWVSPDRSAQPPAPRRAPG